VAGLGTRFLPATKASPKEMLNMVDKPLIQYAVEEAIASGISELIFITGRNKRSIEDHFDKSYELESELFNNNKHELLLSIRNIIPSHIACVYIRQPETLGLGHAVLMAEKLIGFEPFAVLLADDLISSKVPVLKQMIDQFKSHDSTIVGVEEIPYEKSSSYGVIDSSKFTDRLYDVKNLIEKPSPQIAPSNLGVVGRYILKPEIFHHLRQVKPGAGGEIQLTDAIASLINAQRVLAYQYEGVRFDCGSKMGYLKATLQYAFNHPELGAEFKGWCTDFISRQEELA
jgi:UTP--glucose-1-phosphate uridylyltransferase